MNYIKLGKEISFALRHHPEKYHLDMDEEGWVRIEQLSHALEDKYGVLTEADILDIMEHSDKQRYELKNHKIRAYYGHSLKQKIKRIPMEPPKVLYHGTAKRFLDSIMKDGLLPMNRQYVHLSADQETAIKVGKRHDSHPIILRINAIEAYRNGIHFYLGNETVWLSDSIPIQYIKVLDS